MVVEIERVEMVRDGDWHEIGDRLVWSPLLAIGELAPDEVELRLGVVMRDGVPEVREVTFRSVGTGRPVRALDLRIKLDDLLEDAVKLGAFVRSGETGGWRDTPFGRRELAAHPELYGGPWLRPTANDQERLATKEAVTKVRKRPRRKVTDELLREVAEVYRANVDDRPAQAVRERFGMPTSTAALYVQRARQRTDPKTGAPFLGAAIKGKAGEQSP